MDIAQQSWDEWADWVLAGNRLAPDQARRFLQAPDTELLSQLHAAYRIRYRYFGNRVLLNYLINAKSGLCPEDCHYCSQSSVSTAEIPRYRTLSADEIVERAHRGAELSASTCCIVLSGRGPSSRDVDHVCSAVREIKRSMPGMRVCTCLGLLEEEQAKRLAEAGSDRYNHNLNTSPEHYASICTTHTFNDRVTTVERAKHAGISACSGLIVGMGESEDDRIDALRALRELDPDSVPVNFLVAIDGTPLGGHDSGLNPRECLRVLALARLMLPRQEIRVSAGREGHLRSLQPLALYPANALFVSDYLTTPGQSPQLDLEMIEDLGFELQSDETVAVPAD